MRSKLLHPATFISLLALLVALEVPSHAVRFVNGKVLRNNSVPGKKLRDGSVKQRKLAAAVRTKLNRAGSPGPAGSQGPAGGQGPTGPRGPAGAALSCPTGTALHELACVELAQRAQATWVNAFDTCHDAERRLITLAELQTFRYRADLGAPTVGSEWADGGYSKEATTYKGTYLTMNLGVPDVTDASSTVLPYRCVEPAAVG